MEHVTRWLQAYYDGEIPEHKVAAVEAHLAECERCRAALADLEALSGLLQNGPAPIVMPEERFVAQVGLKLPRRPVTSRYERALWTGWRLAPVALLGAWVLVQAALWVAPVAMLLLGFDPGDAILTSLGPVTATGDWLNGLLGGLGVAQAPQLVGVMDFVGETAMFSVGLPLIFGLLIWSWLALGWAYLRHQQLVANGEQS